MEGRNIDMDISDALIEKPYPFTIEAEGQRERHFFLYPVTLGKFNLLQRHMENLDIDTKNIQISPYLEALRVVSTKKDEVCKIFAYHTLKKKRDLFDVKLVNETAEFIRDNSSDEELASLLIYILTKDDVVQFKKHLGITKENDRLANVLRAKRKAQKSNNNYSFGAKSIYGTLIDPICERYKWPYDYVIWGVSLTNLQMLLGDMPQEIYLSDDEKSKIPSSLLNEDDDVINADDKDNTQMILSMDWK